MKRQSFTYLSDMEKVIKAFEEIAAFRMRNTKLSVLKNRQFTDELNDLFLIVKNSYKKSVAEHKVSRVSSKNNKTAKVFLSANTGLYGDMVQRVFNLFIKDLSLFPADPVIIGRLGRTLFTSSSPNIKYTYFEVPDKQLNIEEFKQIIDFLIPYQSIIIYHGYFKNILMQDAVATNLSADQPYEEKQPIPIRKLIFEPSLPGVLDFFESQIFSGLLSQVIFESQLAKFSARMANLEQAGENIKKEVAIARMENLLYKKKLQDKRQIEMLSGRSLWE